VRFTGFPPEALDFYRGLAADNTKAYFDAHREVYAQAVRGPMEALLSELEPEWGPAKVFRPNRDVRFSRDKAPYKTEIGALLATTPGSGWYVRLDADGLGAGGGYPHLSRDQLDRYRRAAGDEATGPALAAAIADAEAAGLEVFSQSLKVAPRGWPRDHPRIDLLRRTSLLFLRTAPPGPEVHTRAALAWVVRTWRDGAPLLAWLDHHVGPPLEQRG
jgi:uncharacterized protein (TIGR02453 family)